MTETTTTHGDHPRLLPMAGHTHGNRSAVTCHLRCGDACFFEAPNTTDTTYFRDVAATALSRRAMLGAGVAATAVGALAGTAVPAAADPRGNQGGRQRAQRPAVHRDRAGRRDRGRRDRAARVRLGAGDPLG